MKEYKLRSLAARAIEQVVEKVSLATSAFIYSKKSAIKTSAAAGQCFGVLRTLKPAGVAYQQANGASDDRQTAHRAL